MGNYALLGVSLLAAAFGTIAKKYYAEKTGSAIVSKCNYAALSFLVAGIGLAIIGNMMKPSLFTLLLSILFGAITALQSITMLIAMRLGPVSYTMMFSSFSTVITALSGVLFFHEKITFLKIIGILLMLVSFVFAVEPQNEKKKGGRAWLLLCITVFLGTGAIGIMQKVHQTSPYKEELDIFLVLAFCVTAIVSFCASSLFKKKESAAQAARTADKKILLPLILSIVVGGICVAANNQLNLFLSGVLEASVFFPIANGGAVVLSTLAAFFLFKERLSVRRWIGLGIGILSVILLCI